MQAFSSHDIFQTLYQQIMLLELKPGSTLRENDLQVFETIVPISARLIANKAGYKFKYDEIRTMSERIFALCNGGT